MEATIDTLTTDEAARLAAIEQRIKAGLNSFIDVGQALIEVRDDRLYRTDYDTFEAYCAGRWNITRRRAYQMIEATEVVGNVQNFTQAPVVESQARTLAKLPATEQPAAWQEAVDTAPDGKVTAAHVSNVVARRIAETVEPDDVDDEAEESEPPARNVHVSNNSGETEWYTPPAYLDAAREVLGEFDLDPASSEFAQRTVKANEFYSEDDSGLEHDWYGRVWLNPPYSAGLVDEFLAKLCKHVDAGDVTGAILLVNNATETKWFQRAALSASAICFTSGRIKFHDSEGKPKNTPLQGQAFLYFGSEPERFSEVFCDFGFCVDVRRAT